MRDDQIILSVNNLSKKYSIKAGDGKPDTVFFALKEISFEVKKGEILGIIGSNGAGKSTLLKILAEVIPPTSGTIEYEGNILSILEIGTGFHQDLSGYDNIFLNASLLGRKKKDTEKVMAAIIEFSGIADFIHEPVKSYSSGMYLRLALSIALFIDYDIILLDEVISVGDVEFRNKAINKIKERTEQGKTCIMISHDLQAIGQLCHKCLLLEKGTLKMMSDAATAIEDYYEGVYNQDNGQKVIPEHEACSLNGVTAGRKNYYTDEVVNIKIDFTLKRKEDFRIVLKVRSYQSNVLTDSFAFRPEFISCFLEAASYSYVCSIPANLINAGNYMVDITLGNETDVFIDMESAEKFTVKLNQWEVNKNWNATGIIYPVRPHCKWELAKAEN